MSVAVSGGPVVLPEPVFDQRLLAESAVAAYEAAVKAGRTVSIEQAHLARIAMITSATRFTPEELVAAVADELAAARVPRAGVEWQGHDTGIRIGLVRRLLALAEHLGVPTRVRYGRGGASTPQLEGPCPGGGRVTVLMGPNGWTWKIRDATGAGYAEGSLAESHAAVETLAVARAVRTGITAFATAQAQRVSLPMQWLLAAADPLPAGRWRVDQPDGGLLRLRAQYAAHEVLWVWARVRSEDRRVEWSWAISGDGSVPPQRFDAAPDPCEVQALMLRAQASHTGRGPAEQEGV
jgi:hypothetical protein